VSNAVDLSNLVQKIQDERAAVALNIFLDRPPSDDLQDLQQMVSNHVDLKRFTLSKVGGVGGYLIITQNLIFFCLGLYQLIFFM
jgi:hypothetical protein